MTSAIVSEITSCYRIDNIDKSKEKGKDQEEPMQSSTTPDPERHMGK